MTTTFAPHRILCALDLSEPIDELLRTATNLAAMFDAHLHLLHVWSPWGEPNGLSARANDLDGFSRGLSLQLDAAVDVARRTHHRVDGTLVPGTVWEQVVLFAETGEYDLIVAGTHGRTGLGKMISGSMAERIVRASSVPVLVVPTHLPDVAAAVTTDRAGSWSLRLP